MKEKVKNVKLHLNYLRLVDDIFYIIGESYYYGVLGGLPYRVLNRSDIETIISSGEKWLDINYNVMGDKLVEKIEQVVNQITEVYDYWYWDKDEITDEQFAQIMTPYARAKAKDIFNILTHPNLELKYQKTHQGKYSYITLDDDNYNVYYKGKLVAKTRGGKTIFTSYKKTKIDDDEIY